MEFAAEQQQQRVPLDPVDETFILDTLGRVSPPRVHPVSALRGRADAMSGAKGGRCTAALR